MTAQSTTTTTTARTTLAQHGGERQSPAPAKQERTQSEAPNPFDADLMPLYRDLVTVMGANGLRWSVENPYVIGNAFSMYRCEVRYNTKFVQLYFQRYSKVRTYAVIVPRSKLREMLAAAHAEAARESARPQPPAPAVVAANVEPPVPPSGEWFGRVTVSAFGAGRRQVFARPAWATPEPPYANYRFDPQTGGYDEFAPYRSVAHEAPF